MLEVFRRRWLRATLAGGRGATAGCLLSPFASPFTSPIATADAGRRHRPTGRRSRNSRSTGSRNRSRSPARSRCSGNSRAPRSACFGSPSGTRETEPLTLSITPPELPFPAVATGSLVVSDGKDWDRGDDCLRRGRSHGHGVEDREQVEPGNKLPAYDDRVCAERIERYTVPVTARSARSSASRTSGSRCSCTWRP